MIRGKSLGLVIPAHNEAEGLSSVLELVPDEIDRVFVINNSSTDNTAEVAMKFGAIVIDQPVKGYGNAYKAGFSFVDTEIVSTVDADGTYPVKKIPELVEYLLDHEIDFISARRIPTDQAGTINNAMRFFGNVILTYFTVLLFWKIIRDSQSGMWVFKREILNDLRLISGGMAFSEELKIEVWRKPLIKCVEIGIPFSYSKRLGKAKLNLWRDGFRNLLFLFAKRFGIPMRRP